jgi:predicted 3-demethylubiquinone-9 3-methyltransferase (glyoxalase superfamily)
MCGWLKDKYGLSWQVTPDTLLELMRGPKAAKVMEAFMKMRKFDIAALKRAAA